MPNESVDWLWRAASGLMGSVIALLWVDGSWKRKCAMVAGGSSICS